MLRSGRAVRLAALAAAFVLPQPAHAQQVIISPGPAPAPAPQPAPAGPGVQIAPNVPGAAPAPGVAVPGIPGVSVVPVIPQVQVVPGVVVAPQPAAVPAPGAPTQPGVQVYQPAGTPGTQVYQPAPPGVQVYQPPGRPPVQVYQPPPPGVQIYQPPAAPGVQVYQPPAAPGVPVGPGAQPPPTVVPAPPTAAATKPAVAEMSFIVGPNVNPDSTGRPSPVIVRTYELKSAAAFMSSDFFSVYDRDKDVLGADLIARDEWALTPGDNRQALKNLQRDTRYVGVVAAFRDVGRARWRASTFVYPNQTTRMEIRLENNEVNIRLH